MSKSLQTKIRKIERMTSSEVTQTTQMKPKNSTLYVLEFRNAATSWRWTETGHRSGSVSQLRDFADLQKTDYRIVHPGGTVEWTFVHRTTVPAEVR